LFLPDTPAIVVLHAVGVPASGGETLLIDGSDALQRLPARVREALSRTDVEITAGGMTATKRLIEHGPFGPVVMFLDPRIGDAIALHRGRRLLDDSMLTAIRKACGAAQTVLVHRWHAGDLLAFSNVAFMHARRSFAGHRLLRRVLVRIDLWASGARSAGSAPG
jgi:alpha-ketoglutarate-dependent taurine dioxygenase